MKAFRFVVAFVALMTAALLPAPAVAEPSPSPTPQEAPSPAPAAKARPYPFRSVVFSTDREAGTFRMGKNKIRLVRVLPSTKLVRDDGSPAEFDDLVLGVEIRGSIRKGENGELEAVTVKIGARATTPEA